MKRLTLVLGLLLVATAVHAQLLWKVTGNGLGRPSYILGTHHMAPSTMIDQIKGMNEAIAGCDIVVGEVEKDSLMSPEVQARMAQAMVAPLDSTLDKVLTPADYGIVEKVFNKYFGTLGMKLKQVNNLKPSAISTQMQAMQAIKYFPNFDANSLIDVMVQTRANEAGRPSVGLESVDEQINLLFNGSIANQAKGLVEACKQDEFFQVQSAALADAYLAQDLDKLLAVMTDATMGGDSEEEMEVLIYSRNRSWAEKLKVIMPERACLVCVGAGHLPGEQGLLQLLRNAGYTVEPMQ
ncbi:MAG: TraB/GumN family protein [Muribaculaceae bacterium]|nr:TraB/GumN family protein [Muribaculaceae bacterium]MBQ1747014.1 TraB/GumN family protein [Muribaculaceae bacterium]MBR0493907.1 TraB/GumN family protein [Muribaculaceae bacterium]